MIKGIPTTHGIEILNSQMRQSVQKYALVGLENPANEDLEKLLDTEDIDFGAFKDFVYHTDFISVGYFDEVGILTYEINLTQINTDRYMYGILLLDTQSEVIAALPTPKIVLIEGVGGIITIKLPIKGDVSEVVFVSSDYVSREEFNAFKASIKPPQVDIPALVEKVTPLIQSRKDFENYAIRQLDSMIARAQFLHTQRWREYDKNKAEEERIGHHAFFFRNELPQGYKPPHAILSILKYPLAYKYFKNTNHNLQADCPEGHFRLPKPSVYLKGTQNLAEVGGFFQEGLPNVYMGIASRNTGAAHRSGPDSDIITIRDTVSLNLASYNNIYGRTSSVEVNRNHLLEGYYVGGGH
ncbi:hypothetical protein LS71_002715 [Helicobacter jaachi]|uniref:Uncharacterized protein n=1 Tax=Helicobacter jaachi TaxID=1677920 RepID=A0A4U8TCH4_9HELI|nr:hypothetical protein [Helicobacter jaachi]TLD97670.1 hypothetical protein LS71_002715 [Helicobacter jaachi]